MKTDRVPPCSNRVPNTLPTYRVPVFPPLQGTRYTGGSGESQKNRPCSSNSRRVFESRQAIYSLLSTMPPLSHWPNRPEPYNDEGSHVLRLIVELQGCDYAEAARILRAAHRAGLVYFDRATLLWQGVLRETSRP
jgi:hypothetical protein